MRRYLTLLFVLQFTVISYSQNKVYYYLDLEGSKDLSGVMYMEECLLDLESRHLQFVDFVRVYSAVQSDLVLNYSNNTDGHSGLCYDDGYNHYVTIVLRVKGKALFEHEFGHFMGFEHVDYGIMRPLVSGSDRLLPCYFELWYAGIVSYY